MSESGRIGGDRVYCHICNHEWDRWQGGLQCPNPDCRSEFVEIVEANTRPQPESRSPASPSPPPLPSHPIHGQITPPNLPFLNHNPWASPADDVTTFEFNTGRGRGTFSFTSRTYTVGGSGRMQDPAAEEVGRNLETMVAGLLGGHNRRSTNTIGGGFFQFPGPGLGSRQVPSPHSPQGQPPDFFSMFFPNLNNERQPRQAGTFDLLGALLNPANAQHGDMVFTSEAFDRVMTQLMEQNQGSGAPPASEAAIESLTKRPVIKDMLDSDGKAECSICMDNVELGDEVTFLPCNHWFHGDCVISWLKEHDTCPHCRQPISPQAENGPRSPRQSRRSSNRRSSSVASPLASVPQDEPARYGPQVIDSPSGLRDARSRYYGSRSGLPTDRPVSERHSSSRSDHGSENNSGVGGWIRNHMPF